MQQEGKPKFLRFHQGSVRGVAFSPRVRIDSNLLLKMNKKNSNELNKSVTNVLQLKQ